jgi:predicted RNase H-like HicB family nuclease
MKGYLVVVEGDDAAGFSAFSPDLPGVVAAADTSPETLSLMRAAMAEHIEILRETGRPVPPQSDIAQVTVLDPAIA